MGSPAGTRTASLNARPSGGWPSDKGQLGGIPRLSESVQIRRRRAGSQEPHPSRIYTYVVASDRGFAPNPFHGWCTLACCKPAIRRTAKERDWIVGITPAGQGPPRMVYAMKVDHIMTFERYWKDRRFRKKRPRWTQEPTIAAGDNCYEPSGSGTFRQLPSWHYDGEHDRERPRAKKRDLGGKYVLVSRHFAYYGKNARPLPADLGFAVIGRGHRVNFDTQQRHRLLAFLNTLPRGRHGLPQRFVDPRTQVTGSRRPPRCS